MCKVVEIEYLDAYLITRVMNLEKIKKEKTPIIKFVGYLVDEDKERVVICSQFYPEDEGRDKNEYTHPFFIPKCSIIKVSELKKLK